MTFLMAVCSAGNVFLLEGTPGTGKTTIALDFMRAGSRLGERCLYITLSETDNRAPRGGTVSRLGFRSEHRSI